jgi:dynactin complex subunit
VKRKSSADTIRESRIPPAPASGLSESDVAAHGPPGATLDIGIPCIITSKRAKFRALARYIGEVAGEAGPWVGVEVPVGDNWASDRLEGRAWHDGTWGGIRYFDLGSGSEWELDAERAARRRRLEAAGALLPGSRALKREGDQLSVDRAKRFRSASPAVSDVSMTESRGLFVRPQQVLYVVDAVGSDF